jgi:hypothetical protein
MLSSNTLLKWQLNVGAHGRAPKHCATCEALNGQVKTWHEWQMHHLPGWHHGCMCELHTVTGIQELDNAPAELPPAGAWGEGPGKGTKAKGDQGEGAGKGTKAGQDTPANPDDSKTNGAKDPTPEPLIPTAPPGTPPSVRGRYTAM